MSWESDSDRRSDFGPVAGLRAESVEIQHRDRLHGLDPQQQRPAVNDAIVTA
jgi:hypothetical protein